MKTLAIQLLCCLSIGILGLHAATKILAPPIIPKGSPIPGNPSAASPALIPDGYDGYYFVMTNNSGVQVYHFLLSSDAGVTPQTYDMLVELENTTMAKALKYVKRQLQ